MDPHLVSRSSYVHRCLLASISVALAACGSSSGTQAVGECTAVRPIAIIAYVTDSVTGREIADSARGVVVSGAYSDSLRLFSDGLLDGGDRTGVYDVMIVRAGYADWTKPGIVATQVTQCSQVMPVHVNARMVPAT